MANKGAARRLGCMAMLAGMPVMLAGTSLPVPDAFEARVLALHNRERGSQGISPLRWNEQLAMSARRWADHLAATGAFEHAPEDPSHPEGENLWAGSKGRFAPDAMVNGWISEKRFFKPGVFPYNSTTGRVADVGHYTQLMWRDTGEVGCARATGAREDVLVCRYGRAGNWIGERPY